MTNNPKYVFPDDTLEVAVKIMENGESQISVLPVIQNATTQNSNTNISQKIFLGLIRLHDVYRH
jgi:CBS domain-containing protein